MKVLIFMTQFIRLNGAERLGVELAEALNKRGIRADIVSLYSEAIPRASEAKEELLRRGIPSVFFLGLPVHPSPFRLIPAAVALRRLVRKGGHDIVETSQISPTVIALWTTLWGPTRHIAGLHHVYSRKLHNSLYQRFWRWSTKVNRRTQFYAISDYARRAWLGYSRTSAGRTRRIYNAIPDECFTVVPDRSGVRDEFGIPRDGRIALYVGRLAAYKGIDTALDALLPVLDAHHLYLLYVGPPDYSVADTKQMMETVQRRIAETNLAKRVLFVGSRDDVPRLMAASDILVHPARTEGFGLVLVEAMAASLPLVASNVEGIPEVLEGTDSIMVPPDDPEALRQAVLRTLYRSPEETNMAVEKGRRRAEDFRQKNRIEAMLRLFQNTINN